MVEMSTTQDRGKLSSAMSTRKLVIPTDGLLRVEDLRSQDDIPRESGFDQVRRTNGFDGLNLVKSPYFVQYESYCRRLRERDFLVRVFHPNCVLETMLTFYSFGPVVHHRLL
jgi:hypothetical protein